MEWGGSHDVLFPGQKSFTYTKPVCSGMMKYSSDVLCASQDSQFLYGRENWTNPTHTEKNKHIQ